MERSNIPHVSIIPNMRYYTGNILQDQKHKKIPAKNNISFLRLSIFHYSDGYFLGFVNNKKRFQMLSDKLLHLALHLYLVLLTFSGFIDKQVSVHSPSFKFHCYIRIIRSSDFQNFFVRAQILLLTVTQNIYYIKQLLLFIRKKPKSDY